MASDLSGFIYLIKRKGISVRLGPIVSAHQLFAAKDAQEQEELDYMIRAFRKRGYYVGTPEEYEEFRGKVAGDMDGDGDRDADDKAIEEKASAETSKQRKGANKARKQASK